MVDNDRSVESDDGVGIVDDREWGPPEPVVLPFGFVVQSMQYIRFYPPSPVRLSRIPCPVFWKRFIREMANETV